MSDQVRQATPFKSQGGIVFHKQRTGRDSVPTQPTSAVVRLVGARKSYGSGDSRVTALDGVSLDFRAGSFTAVMGPSGSGKSTLLQCAAGLDRLDEGEITLAGVNPAGMSETALTRLRRERI